MMRIPKFTRFILVGALSIVGVLGVAFAQEGTSVKGDTSAGMKREVKLSPEEQLAAADSILARMDSATKNVRKQLELARQQRDVVKSLCLSDKLTQMDVTRKSAGERHNALRQAVSRQDNELASHEYTILVVFRERSDQLAAEANQCVGEEIGIVGETQITVDIDPNLPKEDPSEYPESGPIIAVPPSCVSCYN